MSMTIELRKVLINQGRVQEHRQFARQIHGQSLSTRMEIIQMILQANSGAGRELGRVKNAGNNAALFFLGGKALYQNIIAGRDEQTSGFIIGHNRVRFAASRLGPMNETTVEVARVNQWHGVGCRLIAQK